MKKIFKTCLLLMTLFAFPLIVKANSIDKIDMNIYVDKEGTAHVTETWSANLNQGTEGYKPYYNIGDANIRLAKQIGSIHIPITGIQI